MYDNRLKIGLGLWNFPATALAIELALLFGGMYLYLRTTEAVSGAGRYGMVAFGFVMACVQVALFFGPPPSSDRAAAITALTLYAVFAAAAYWLEKKRVPKMVQGSLRTHSVPAR